VRGISSFGGIITIRSVKIKVQKAKMGLPRRFLQAGKYFTPRDDIFLLDSATSAE
jgi:hypothetical protein